MTKEELQERVNPFAFPSQTSIIFLMIVLSVIAPGIFLCHVAGLILTDISIFAKPPFPTLLINYSFLVSILVVFPCLVLYFYCSAPKKTIRKFSLKPLEIDFPEISNLISQIKNNMDVKDRVVPLLAEDEGHGATLFGTHKACYIAVTRGLCRIKDTLPELVETILRHELSHLRNKDVTQHQISESVFKAYALTSAFELIFFLSAYLGAYGTEEWFMIATVLAIFLVPTITLYFLNDSLRRAREIYADARVASFDKTTENVASSLRMFIVPKLGNHLSWPMHGSSKSPRQRILSLEDNSIFLSPNFIRGLMTGVISALFGLALFTRYIMSVENPLPLIEPFQNIGLNQIAHQYLFLFWLTGYVILSVSLLPGWFIALREETGKQCVTRLLLITFKVCAGWLSGFLLVCVILRIPYPTLFLEIGPAETQIAVFGLLIALSYFATFISHFLATALLFMFHKLQVSSKTRFVLVEFTPLLLTSPFVYLVFDFLGDSSLSTLRLLYVLIAIMATLGTVVFARCPKCGKRMKKNTEFFKCLSCSREFNRDILDKY